MAKPGQSGLARVISATRYSYQGLKAQWKHEAAFRQETCLFIIALPFALWLGDSGLEKALLIFSAGMVLIVETINSSVEAVVDRISNEQHELSGRAKDLGSAAVMLSLVFAAVVWALVIFG